MPEFLQKRYDKRSRYYFSLITIIGNVLVDTAAGLYVGSIVLKLLFPDISSTIIIIILAVAAAAYTIPGGLNSVIQTEVIQAVLLIIGSCLLTYFAYEELGGGWNTMMEKLDAMLAAGEVAAIEGVTGKRLNLRHMPRRAGDPAVLVADATKARDLLGFTARHSDLDTIIRDAAPAFGGILHDA